MITEVTQSPVATLAAVDDAETSITYSIVIPVYNNQDSVVRLLSTLQDTVDQLDAPAEVVFVIDGSPDDSHDRIQELLPSHSFAAQVIAHSRNFGSFSAIRTGIGAAKGRFIAVIAADLQEPPDLLLAFFAALSTGVADVVVGRRERRDDPSSSRHASQLYWQLYRRFVIPEVPSGGVDVFGLNRSAATELLGLSESSSSLIGQLYWIGFRRLEIPYHRQARQEGVSGWTLHKKVRYMSDSIFSFTSLPISVMTWLGALGLIGAILLSVFTFVAWLLGWVTEPGYTSLMLVLLNCTFLIVLSLGIVGNYVWRTYENSKARPGSITSEVREYGRNI